MEPYLHEFNGGLSRFTEILLNEKDTAIYTDYRKVRYMHKECSKCNLVSILLCFSSTSYFINCDIIAVPAQYDFKPNAFGLPKHSEYLGIFNYYIQQLSERGMLEQIISRFNTAKQICPDYSGKALGMNSVFTAFFPLFVGAGMAVIFFAFEMHTGWDKTKKKNDSRKMSKVNLNSASYYGHSYFW